LSAGWITTAANDNQIKPEVATGSICATRSLEVANYHAPIICFNPLCYTMVRRVTHMHDLQQLSTSTSTTNFDKKRRLSILLNLAALQYSENALL
jgi:hypothetical protein